MGVEILEVKQEYTTMDLLLWRRFGLEVPGTVEKTLGANPGSAEAGAFLPVGMKITVDLADFETPAPTVRKVVRLW